MSPALYFKRQRILFALADHVLLASNKKRNNKKKKNANKANTNGDTPKAEQHEDTKSDVAEDEPEDDVVCYLSK